LIVDDNQTNRRILENQLRLWHYIPLVAASGFEALEHLRSGSSIDLIITDMQMPGMNGLHLSQAIKKDFPDLPIMVLSSLGDLTAKQHQNLFHAILNKPVKQRQLGMEIMRILRKRPSEIHHQDSRTSWTSATNHDARIVVAEDNPINQMVVRKMLGKMGYEVNIVESGEAAIEATKQSLPDIIFMDVQMPGMDGLEATRSIRKLKLTKQPVIIAMTANAMEKDREDCLAAGMNDYISKPVMPKILREKITKWNERVALHPM
jgi:CheY-like chemotaxis protein